MFIRFQVRKGELVRCQSTEQPAAQGAAVDDHQEAGSKQANDNRDVTDNNNAQRLDDAAIEALRNSGASGEAIISSLVKGSDTFAKKTDFSKEKYLKRKAKKYLPWVRLLEPRSAPIARAYFARGHAKNVVLRWDSLAEMLSRANVRQGTTACVVDGTGGVLSGAVLERLGEKGRILMPHVTERPQAYDALRRFNFDKDVARNAIVPLRLNAAHKEKARCLLVASRHDPLAVLKALLPMLRPSSSLVVYCDTMEPLLPCFAFLQEDCLRIQLTEAWLRDFQVLPNRTHPTMTVSASGGYLLSAIVLKKDDGGGENHKPQEDTTTNNDDSSIWILDDDDDEENKQKKARQQQ